MPQYVRNVGTYLSSCRSSSLILWWPQVDSLIVDDAEPYISWSLECVSKNINKVTYVLNKNNIFYFSYIYMI